MTDDTPTPAPTASPASPLAPQGEGAGGEDPTPTRQAKLRAAYDANLAAGKPPYERVEIGTLGELQWVLRERDWSVDLLAPAEQHSDLRGADLRGANLSGADLRGANLRGGDLRAARMDAATVLAGVTLDGKTQLGDLVWNGVPLQQVESWPARLGDEQAIQTAKSRKDRIDAYRYAARAYRGLSIALRGQGLLIPASDYRLREQVLERKAKLLEFSLLGWVFSWLLNLVASYGEKPVRSFIAYLLILLGFAGAYLTATNSLLGFGSASTQVQPLQWYEALVLSVSAFHGRGFFQPVQSLGDPVAILAAVEAVIGLFIEITFIATFTQRFFGGR